MGQTSLLTDFSMRMEKLFIKHWFNTSCYEICVNVTCVFKAPVHKGPLKLRNMWHSLNWGRWTVTGPERCWYFYSLPYSRRCMHPNYIEIDWEGLKKDMVGYDPQTSLETQRIYSLRAFDRNWPRYLKYIE